MATVARRLCIVQFPLQRNLGHESFPQMKRDGKQKLEAREKVVNITLDAGCWKRTENVPENHTKTKSINGTAHESPVAKKC